MSASPVSVSSFGRSFLVLRSGRSVSLRRAAAALAAARRRWPSGSLDVSGSCIRWMVDGCCGVLVVFRWPASARAFARRA